MAKAKSLTETEVNHLGLELAATSIGLDGWSADIYPDCVNFISADDKELAQAFLGWPLPDQALEEKSARALSDAQRYRLAQLWSRIKRQYRLGGEDSLPYSRALDDLRTRFACDAGLYVRNDQIYRVLQNLRKASKRPSGAKERPSAGDQEPTLFD
jgi:hypothetical protein